MLKTPNAVEAIIAAIATMRDALRILSCSFSLPFCMKQSVTAMAPSASDSSVLPKNPAASMAQMNARMVKLILKSSLYVYCVCF